MFGESWTMTFYGSREMRPWGISEIPSGWEGQLDNLRIRVSPSLFSFLAADALMTGDMFDLTAEAGPDYWYRIRDQWPDDISVKVLWNKTLWEGEVECVLPIRCEGYKMLRDVHKMLHSRRCRHSWTIRDLTPAVFWEVNK